MFVYCLLIVFFFFFLQIRWNRTKFRSYFEKKFFQTIETFATTVLILNFIIKKKFILISNNSIFIYLICFYRYIKLFFNSFVFQFIFNFISFYKESMLTTMMLIQQHPRTCLKTTIISMKTTWKKHLSLKNCELLLNLVCEKRNFFFIILNFTFLFFFFDSKDNNVVSPRKTGFSKLFSRRKKTKPSKDSDRYLNLKFFWFSRCKM